MLRIVRIIKDKKMFNEKLREKRNSLIIKLNLDTPTCLLRRNYGSCICTCEKNSETLRDSNLSVKYSAFL